MLIKDEDCPRCEGNGWITVRRAAHGLYGLFEEDCPRCNGAGCVTVDIETGDEVENSHD